MPLPDSDSNFLLSQPVQPDPSCPSIFNTPTVFISHSDSSTPSNSSRDRPSSEATLATIYSMYGDPMPNHAPNPSYSHEKQFPARSSESLPPSPSPSPPLPDPCTTFEPSPLPLSPSIDLSVTHQTVPLCSSRSPRLPVEDKLLPNVPLASAHLPDTLSCILPELAEPKPSQQPSEDPDNYFVRCTYAELDSTGVEGDGYEEGIERTRARLAHFASESLPRRSIHDLSDAELKVLSSVDRYGFYAMTSGERQVSLPKPAPLSLYKHISSSVDPSPLHAQNFPHPQTTQKEQSRIDKWERMILPVRRNENVWRVNKLKEHKLRERVYKGIPDRWRRAVWDLLISSFKGSVHHRDYSDMLNEPSEFDIQIDLDVPRTISGHVMFRTRYGLGQRSLFHVLHCFSLHCGECGYCQGMGPIAATFLCYVEADKAHEWMCYLHTAYSMHSIFRPGFPGLLENIYVQEALMKRMMPGVYEAFRKHNISTTSYATKWYITLFANAIPFQSQLRLWDAFLLEGQDVIVIMALSIVWTMKDHILSKLASFETILSLLSSFFTPESDDHLLSWISKVMGDENVRQEMTDSRTVWNQLVEKGEEGRVLL